MPHTTAPIGSLIGKTFGRVGAKDDHVGAHARLERPGDPGQPGHPRAVDRGVPDHVPRAHQVRHAALAGQLPLEHRGVLQRDRRPHLGEHVARARRARRRSQARDGCRGRSAAGSAGDPAAGRPSRSTARARSTLRTRRWRRGRRRRARAVHERDVGPRRPRSASLGDHARPRVPASQRGRGCAGPAARAERPSAGRRVEIRGHGRGRTERDRGREAASSGPGDGPCLVGRTVTVSVDEHRAQPGVRVRLERGLREPVVRARSSDQSTTVVIPASTAPSSPIRVAA